MLYSTIPLNFLLEKSQLIIQSEPTGKLYISIPLAIPILSNAIPRPPSTSPPTIYLPPYHLPSAALVLPMLSPHTPTNRNASY